MQTIISVKARAQRPSIIDVIQAHVNLRQSGRELWGLCPFHAEKTPSFAVNPEKEVFYCHACHAGGDVIAFVQKIEDIDFKAAVARLGLDDYLPSPAALRIKSEAKQIAAWAHATSGKIRDA